jgi:two-component system, sensor histidine kinase LadS
MNIPSGAVSRHAVALAFLPLFWLYTTLATADPDTPTTPKDITSTFQILQAPWGALTPADFFDGSATDRLTPLNPPANVSILGQDTWLYSTLDSRPPSGILEIPGQLFNHVDIWFRFPDGRVLHDKAGDRNPYIDRTVKHANVAFPLPPETSGSLDVLIRMKNLTSHPMHFAALVWPQQLWQDYVLSQRTWYAFFLGAIAALCIYNAFLSVTLRDTSYLYYIGYVLCLTFSVVLCSGLAEEFLWPSGQAAPLVLAATGLGTFMGVGFVNNFLKIHLLYPLTYKVSTILAAIAAVLGAITVFSNKLPLFPEVMSASIVHGLLIVGGIYFITVSFVSYLMGIVQARFLALSMFILMSSTVIYFLYTSAKIPYNLYVGHFLEFGALAEGILLSLALADRIKVITARRLEAERMAREYQDKFTRAVITTQERERQVLSETMHDSVGHGLLVLKGNLQRCADALRAEDRTVTTATGDMLAEQIGYCGEIMRDVRNISHDLHPHMLKRLGLAAAVKSTIDRALTANAIETDIEVCDLPDNMNPEIEITVYRVIQECMNNILKHAEATRVTCRISSTANAIEVQLMDNGMGFSFGERQSKTLGLLEMEGRVRMLGGHFNLTSQPGEGTEVQFRLPYAADAADTRAAQYHAG